MENTTEALARRLGIRPNSIRSRLCRYGSYFGIRPIKLLNGRLVWPDDAFKKLSERG